MITDFDVTPRTVASHMGDVEILAVPCVVRFDGHRDKSAPSNCPFSLSEARPVGKKDIEANVASQRARKAEWKRLEAQDVSGISPAQEWNDVPAEA